MRGIERYFYDPNFLQKALAIVLLPISILYCGIATLRRVFARYEDFGIPIISVGNLVIGGSGKSPFILEIAKEYSKVCIILRGYGRKSKGLKVVSVNGEIFEDSKNAGDESIMIAKALKNASVIVCENRKKGILEAKKIGAQIVFLDDGFRFNFKKLSIVLQPKLEPYFNFCIPSGGYRERKSAYKRADILIKEGVDYKREVKLVNPTKKMLLLTAIANPSRLDEYLPDVVGKITLKDHSYFDKVKILEEYQRLEATSLLVTQKDIPKLESFGLPLSILQLEMVITPEVKQGIREYIAKALSSNKFGNILIFS